jgi:hypothetical protein
MCVCCHVFFLVLGKLRQSFVQRCVLAIISLTFLETMTMGEIRTDLDIHGCRMRLLPKVRYLLRKRDGLYPLTWDSEAF